MTLLDVTLATGYREWMEDAYCNQPGQQPDDWYPETPEGSWAAKKLCKAHCPVIDECLRYALDNSEFEGVWGGLTAPERRKLAKKGATAPEGWAERKRAACEQNHPGEEPEPAFRGNGRWRCRACERVYKKNERSDAA